MTVAGPDFARRQGLSCLPKIVLAWPFWNPPALVMPRAQEKNSLSFALFLAFIHEGSVLLTRQGGDDRELSGEGDMVLNMQVHQIVTAERLFLGEEMASVISPSWER